MIHEERSSIPFAPKVFQLGYVALAVTDLERSKDHYAETIGMAETERGHDGESFLSIGYEHHNIVLRPAGSKALMHLGFQLKPDIEVGTLLSQARAFGLSGVLKSDSQPGIRELVEIEGPGGNVFQFYSHIEAPAPGFKRTGVAPLRLGHVAVFSSEAEKLMRFYLDFLGFAFTDTVGGLANFYTCNRDHHVVNIINVPEDRLHHIAFELKENACHATACDVLRSKGVPVLWGPARHTAGHNLAGYHYDPDKTMVEFYTDMDIFIPELNMFEARPWHGHYPMRPHEWKLGEICTWDVEFAFNPAKG